MWVGGCVRVSVCLCVCLCMQDGAARMKGNIVKCHLLMTKDKSSEIHIDESIIKSSDCKKLLGIKIDLKLHF